MLLKRLVGTIIYTHVYVTKHAIKWESDNVFQYSDYITWLWITPLLSIVQDSCMLMLHATLHGYNNTDEGVALFKYFSLNSF